MVICFFLLAYCVPPSVVNFDSGEAILIYNKACNGKSTFLLSFVNPIRSATHTTYNDSLIIGGKSYTNVVQADSITLSTIVNYQKLVQQLQDQSSNYRPVYFLDFYPENKNPLPDCDSLPKKSIQKIKIKSIGTTVINN